MVHADGVPSSTTTTTTTASPSSSDNEPFGLGVEIISGIVAAVIVVVVIIVCRWRQRQREQENGAPDIQTQQPTAAPIGITSTSAAAAVPPNIRDGRAAGFNTVPMAGMSSFSQPLPPLNYYPGLQPPPSQQQQQMYGFYPAYGAPTAFGGQPPAFYPPQGA